MTIRDRVEDRTGVWGKQGETGGKEGSRKGGHCQTTQAGLRVLARPVNVRSEGELKLTVRKEGTARFRRLGSVYGISPAADNSYKQTTTTKETCLEENIRRERNRRGHSP